jgi:hypothetical protein
VYVIAVELILEPVWNCLLLMRYNLNKIGKVVSSRSLASRVPHGPVLVLSRRSGLRDPRAHFRRSALEQGGLGTYDGHRRTAVAVPVPMPALRARWPRHPPTHGVAASDLDRSHRDRLFERSGKLT